MSIGLKSEVVIEVAVRAGFSRLGRCFQSPPFKVADITEDRRLGLQLMLMCSSPGVLDGDEQVFRVRLSAGARLHLSTQSYQRLFRMRGSASVKMEVLLEKGASFCWLPHPVVPHAESSFRSFSRVDLSEGSELIWGEVLTCGRKLNGEVFEFSLYHSRVEVFYGEKLVMLENCFMRPSAIPVSAMGQLEGFTHQGNFIYIKPDSLIWKTRLSEVEELLSGQEGIRYGVSEGPGGSLVVRLLGHKAEQLYGINQSLAMLMGGFKSLL